ncbi:hypothetical protein HanRHA438_Chr01g0034371 [Helianthus annuus]|nr:hypothetical protein HanRHA438_Chr01g0034371 [Helianthus annuus]
MLKISSFLLTAYYIILLQLQRNSREAKDKVSSYVMMTQCNARLMYSDDEKP